jgi:hypothetical protein
MTQRGSVCCANFVPPSTVDSSFRPYKDASTQPARNFSAFINKSRGKLTASFISSCATFSTRAGSTWRKYLVA